MPVSRMRMRPWLEKMIDSNSVAGLVWVDKRQKIFSIPWKHAARHGWELDKDACLFKQWAIHTGKYVEGQTSADPKTWKANFRCAMNSLPDIEEVKNKSINKGHQAMRVYRMLPVSPKCKRAKGKDTKRRNKSASVKLEDMDISDAQSPVNSSSQLNDNTPSTQENTVNSTENQEFTFVNPSEVPDWTMSIEIGPDSTNEHSQRFQVSPEHSPAHSDMDEEIIKICQQMEFDSSCFISSSDYKGFLSSFPFSSSYSYCSPGSQWSDDTSEFDSSWLKSNSDIKGFLNSLPLKSSHRYSSTTSTCSDDTSSVDGGDYLPQLTVLGEITCGTGRVIDLYDL